LLAERTRSITEVGLALGFAETSSFSATFHKLTGKNPGLAAGVFSSGEAMRR
jgi:AraC family transcriptional regulator